MTTRKKAPLEDEFRQARVQDFPLEREHPEPRFTFREFVDKARESHPSFELPVDIPEPQRLRIRRPGDNK